MANCAFPCHICIYGRVRGKWEFPIKIWEEMRKVRLIMYSAVSALLFCVENSPPVKIRRKDAHMPPDEMVAVTLWS